MSRRQAWIDIILALLLVGASVVMAGLVGTFIARQHILLLLALQGLTVLAGLWLLLAVRGEGWRHIGLHAITLKDFGRTLMTLLACIGVNAVFAFIVFNWIPETLQSHLSRLQAIAALLNKAVPFIGIVAMMLFVGLYEEITARGFLLKRCRIALGSEWAAVFLSSFLFGLGHLYQGGIGVAQTTLFGIVLAVFTVRWGTLWPAIFAHAMLNIFSLAMLERIARQAPLNA